MNYQAALEWIYTHKHIIGTQDESGLIISDILLVPSDSNNQDRFLREYVLTKDKNAILPYIDKELEVWGIDPKYITTHGIFLHKRLI